MANTFEDYSETITTLARFERKRDADRHSHPQWRMVNEMLAMLIRELVREQSYIEKDTAPKKGRADEEMADLLHRYNILNREEVELDRRDIDVDLAGKMRKRPGK